MSESSTNVEPKGKKKTFKRKKSGSNNEHIEVNVEVVDGANGAKTESLDLAASLKQGFAQMSQDIAKTIAQSFQAFRSEFDLQYEHMVEEELGEIPSAVGDDEHKVAEEPP